MKLSARNYWKGVRKTKVLSVLYTSMFEIVGSVLPVAISDGEKFMLRRCCNIEEIYESGNGKSNTEIIIL